MSRYLKKVSVKRGMSPGSLVHVGKQKMETPRIYVIDITPEKVTEKEVETAPECFNYRDTRSLTWINIDGLHDPALLQQIGDHYKIHPLVLEDILNTGQRAKIEDHDQYLFSVLRMLHYTPKNQKVFSEQVSFVMGKNYLISFQEQKGDVFDSVRERLRQGKGRIRKSGADYLLYALMDSVVDSYFGILEQLADQVESLETELLSHPGNKTLRTIHALKRELVLIRKSVWPLREAINTISRGESDLVEQKTLPYYRDVYDHTIQIMDTVEALRDTVSGMLDIYLSSLSNRMNEVMKVLTVIATIFIPLTFITGVYGMNFDFMPELRVWWAYPLIWVIMIGVAFTMGLYFRKKGWF